jgi:hypothetical protein
MWHSILWVSCLTILLISLRFAIPPVWRFVQDLREGGFTGDVSSWYHVRSDSSNGYIELMPPGGEAGSIEFKWDDVVRVCWLGRLPPFCDELHFFIAGQPKSLVIPTAADDADALVSEIISRQLTPGEQLFEAMTKADGVFYWPPIE